MTKQKGNNTFFTRISNQATAKEGTAMKIFKSRIIAAALLLVASGGLAGCGGPGGYKYATSTIIPGLSSLDRDSQKAIHQLATLASERTSARADSFGWRSVTSLAGFKRQIIRLLTLPTFKENHGCPRRGKVEVRSAHRKVDARYSDLHRDFLRQEEVEIVFYCGINRHELDIEIEGNIPKATLTWREEKQS